MKVLRKFRECHLIEFLNYDINSTEIIVFQLYRIYFSSGQYLNKIISSEGAKTMGKLKL